MNDKISLGMKTGAPRRKKLKVALCLLIVVLLIGAAGLWYFFVYKAGKGQEQSAQAEQNSTYVSGAANIKQTSNDNSAAMQDLAKKYSNQCNEITKSLVQTTFSAWGRDELDKAYFCLTYADKVGDVQQMKFILAMLKSVSDAKVDIDNNSLGIKQQQRDAYTARSNKWEKS